jgi:hypothetical protein
VEIPPYGGGIALSLAGEDVWFVSPDAPLVATAEGAICLLAPWCARYQQALHLPDERPSAAFLANVRSAIAHMCTWWGYAPLVFRDAKGVVADLPAAAALPVQDGALALFFSGGVDSFHSLTRNPGIRAIVFIIGFDMGLDQRPVWETLARNHQALAEERGIRLIRVFTNLRQHRALGKGHMDLKHYHGAILATVAHALHQDASRWLISASFTHSNPQPWGSHPDLDWRWGSERVTLTHFGADLWRAQKLVSMTDHALVDRHLHVCFTDPTTAGNCGRCEKCVRTRLIYHCEIPGRRCERMPETVGLAQAIDSLRKLRSTGLMRAYERFLVPLPAEDPVAGSLKRLLERSAAALQGHQDDGRLPNDV